VKELANRFLKGERGVTSIEYGLISSLVAVAIIVSAKALGSKIASTFSYSSSSMKGVGESNTRNKHRSLCRARRLA
jgi:pilus assembly protein Flp/PilA